MSSAVTVTDLSKAYGEVEAVRGISFEIAAGEIFGLLGPNGAGKTTTVEILEGYRRRDAGSVTVLGVDPAEAGQSWRERIGVVLQSSAMYPTLTVAESLDLFGGYYERPRSVDEVVHLLERTGARAFTRDEARRHRDQALAELDAAGVVRPAARQRLEEIIVWVISA